MIATGVGFSMSGRAEIIQRLKSVLSCPSAFEGDAFSYDRLQTQATAVGSIINELIRAAEDGGYLTKSLSYKYNSECCLKHYLFLCSNIVQHCLAHVLDGLVIFEYKSAAAVYSITIEATLEYFEEGELSLNFRVDGVSSFRIFIHVCAGRHGWLDGPGRHSGFANAGSIRKI